MLRVIAGKYKNKKLMAADDITRPLTDRIKTSIFDILREFTTNAKVLDLFGGSGGFAIEAISRGAASAEIVENNSQAIAIINQNLKNVGINDEVTVIQDDVFDFLAAVPEQTYDIIMIDPPFPLASDQKNSAVELAAKLLNYDGVLVFRYPTAESYDFKSLDLEEAYAGDYGESKVVFLHNLRKSA